MTTTTISTTKHTASDMRGEMQRKAGETGRATPSSWASALEEARTTMREGMAEMKITALGPEANEIVGAADALARLLPDLAFHVAGLEVTDNDDAKRLAAALAAGVETFAARIDALAAELDALAELQPARGDAE